MGGICSRSSNAEVSYSKEDSDRGQENSGVNGHKKTVIAPPEVIGVEEVSKSTADEAPGNRRGVRAPEDFYDGIPQYPKTFSLKSRSVRSTQAAVAKVTEVSSRLGKAGKGGLGKAVEVLDTLGSSMTNFNSGNGFATAGHAKGNEIGILSFEIANTIVKGSNLMQSLSKGSLRQLREDVLPSEGVRHLISEDTHELMRIVAADKREDLKIFSGEVIRFGNRCKDPQWHNLDRYFEKISKGAGPQKDLEEEADLVIQQLMALVQYTAELYHEQHALDRFEQDFNRRRVEAEASTVPQKEKGDSMSMLRSELKSQKKLVKHLKKKSLWSKSLEEVMEKLVDIVHFIHLVIQKEFGASDDDHHNPAEEFTTSHSKLGAAGLSLHYANMIIQIDTLVARSSNMPQNTRETLYQSLPPFLKSSLRSKLKSFCVKEEMSIKEIKDEMEKTLGWLVPVATNTAKAHHGFGWVGEWANSGGDGSRKTTAQAEIMRIETLHHADKERTESHVRDMLLWLNHLAAQSKPLSLDSFAKSTPAAKSTPLLLTPEDRALLNDVGKEYSKKKKKRAISEMSKSRDFDGEGEEKKKNERQSSGRSRSYSPPRGTREAPPRPLRRVSSGPRIPGFAVDKRRVLDAIDRVEETPR